jgi:hypothetical protein
VQRLVADAAKQEEQDEPGQERGDHERRERAERVDEIGARELRPSTQRGSEAEPLDERRRHGKADEREPRKRDDVEPRQHEDALQDERHEGDEADRECVPDVPLVDVDGKPDAARADVRERPDRRPQDRDQRPIERVGQLREHERDGRWPEPERERRPEAGAVEADRLGDELSDGSRLGRERRRKLRPGHVPRLARKHRPTTDPVRLDQQSGLVERLEVD